MAFGQNEDTVSNVMREQEKHRMQPNELLWSLLSVLQNQPPNKKQKSLTSNTWTNDFNFLPSAFKGCVGGFLRLAE